MKYILRIIIFAFIFNSCGTMRINKTSDFSTIKDVKDLEGNYLNQTSGNSILSCFNIREYANFVSITSEKPNEIKLIYYNDSTKQERIFTGQMKKNFFEIYFSKQQAFIPLIYSSCKIERIRIGKSNDGKLLIREFVNESGNILFLAAGYSIEKPYLFLNATEFKGYIPFQENDLWGYSDASGKIVVPPKYDFAFMFEQGIARIKLNNKWGLINKQGKEITPIKYDNISFIDTIFSPPIFSVTIGEKVGVLDLEGNETIPVIYDFIASSNMSYYGLFSIQLGDMFGFANRTQVVIPAIYSQIYSIDENTAIAKRDGVYYIVDKLGYEYETTGIGLMRDAKPSTRRKIKFEEQKLE